MRSSCGFEVVHHPHVFVLQIVAVEHKRAVKRSKPETYSNDCIRTENLSVVIADFVPFKEQLRVDFEIVQGRLIWRVTHVNNAVCNEVLFVTGNLVALQMNVDWVPPATDLELTHPHRTPPSARCAQSSLT